MSKVLAFVILLFSLLNFVSCDNSKRKIISDQDFVSNDVDNSGVLDADVFVDEDVPVVEEDISDADILFDADSDDPETDDDTLFPDDDTECSTGEQRNCYTGSEETRNIGSCLDGLEDCIDGSWSGICNNEVLPSEEVCDYIDNNCDNIVDNGFDLSSDINNCNECGKICSARNSYAGCDDGMCRYGCLNNYFDTNLNEYDGCEAGCLAPEKKNLITSTSVLFSDFIYLEDGYKQYVVIYSGLSADSTEKGIFLSKYDADGNVISGFDKKLVVEPTSATVYYPFASVGYNNKKFFIAWIHQDTSANKEYLMYNVFDSNLTPLYQKTNIKELGPVGTAKNLKISKVQNSAKMELGVFYGTTLFLTYLNTNADSYDEITRTITSMNNHNFYVSNDDSYFTALGCKKINATSYIDLASSKHNLAPVETNVDAFPSSATCGIDTVQGDLKTFSMVEYLNNYFAVAYKNSRGNIVTSFYKRASGVISSNGSKEFENVFSAENRLIDIEIYSGSDSNLLVTYILKSGTNYNYYYFMLKKSGFTAEMIGSPVKYFTTAETPERTFGKYADSMIYLFQWYETAALDKKIDISIMKSCSVE